MNARVASDWAPASSVVALIADMPLPDDAWLKQIVEALARKMAEAPRLQHAVDALSFVYESIEDAATDHGAQLDLSCEACAGTGGERAPCKPCGGRGVASCFGGDL